MENYVLFTQFLANAATGFAVIVAAVSLMIGWRQHLRNARLQRETDATQLFRDYLKVALEHPEFADPDLTKLKEDMILYTRYEWFVAFMLYGLEAIFLMFPEDESW